MNLKRIICLLLALILLLSLVTGAISLLVMNASAAELTTQPTASETQNPTQPSEPTVNQMELKNGDKIVVFILGAIVPCIIFLVMLVKVVWRGK